MVSAFYAGIQISFLGCLSILMNACVLLVVGTNRTFGYAFGRICISHTISNMGNAIVFGLLVGPMTFLNEDLHETYVGKRCGQLLIFFWNASVFTHFLTAFNRFVIISSPLQYAQIFHRRFTHQVIAAAWACSFLQVIPYFWPQCAIEYKKQSHSFQFNETTCGYITGTIFDLYLSIIMVSVIAIMDLLTFKRIRTVTKKMSVTVMEQERRRKREIRFFFQACTQGCCFITELILYFYIKHFFHEQSLAHFYVTTGAWICVHIVDGLIVILFNHELRRLVEFLSVRFTGSIFSS